MFPYGYEVNTVYSDNGNEYIKNFDNFLTEKHIVHIFGNVDDKRMTSPIERFNGTLRLSIEKYKATYGRVSKNVLPAIIDAYNNSVHSVGYTPMDILKSESIHNIVQEKYVKKCKQYYDKDVLSGYCRILLNTALFSKLGANWSRESYKIKKYNPTNNRYVLEGVDGEFESERRR